MAKKFNMARKYEIKRDKDQSARIISAFPGTGKSHFAREYSDEMVLDLASTTFRWLTTEDGGREKNPDFPANYLECIKQNLGVASLVLVSTHQEITNTLVDEGLPFTLVYPERELKDEYLDRFKQRGSPETFVTSLANRWDSFIDHLELQPGCERIRLTSGQYLSDIFDGRSDA
jgi:hypothetical protein